MENPHLIQEDEIDLREYIKVITKRKIFILGVFLIAVIATAIFSYSSPKVYKATATIMITPSVLQNALSPSKGLWDMDKNDSLGGDKMSPWNISIDTHVNLLKSNLVLQRTIQKLNLKDVSGKDETVENLEKNLNIMKAVGESVLQLEASDVNPQKAKDIANTWAEQYVEYSQELVLGEVNGIGDFVMTQFENSKKSLFEAEEAVNDFKKDYKQDVMSSELTIKKEALNNYKKELAGMVLDLKTKEDNLIQLKKQIAKQKRFIIVSKAITDDALWQISSQEDGIPGFEKKGLKSEDINPIYQDLESRIVNGEVDVNTLRAREEYLNNSIEILTAETKELDDEILQKDFDLTQLMRQVDFSKKAYDDFSNKVQEARITKEAQFGEVKIVSPASVPDYPQGGKAKTVVLVGVFSLIFGIFLAFFIEFWQKCLKS